MRAACIPTNTSLPEEGVSEFGELPTQELLDEINRPEGETGASSSLAKLNSLGNPAFLEQSEEDTLEITTPYYKSILRLTKVDRILPPPAPTPVISSGE